MNPAAMFKIMQAKNTFTKNHPKFEAFLKNVMANKIVEGTVIEVSIQRPGEEAITTNSIQKYHFILLRNLYEKTANFLGYPQWSELLPDDKKVYYNRIIQFTSHSTLSNEVVPDPTEPEKQVVKFLLDHLVDNNYYKEKRNGTV